MLAQAGDVGAPRPHLRSHRSNCPLVPPPRLQRYAGDLMGLVGQLAHDLRLLLGGRADGSLCVRSRPLPANFSQVVEARRDLTSIVCAESLRECEHCRVTPIVIPPLAGRADEIERIIHE